MEGQSVGQPVDEWDWATVDLTELFGQQPESANTASRLAKGLPPPVSPPPFPSSGVGKLSDDTWYEGGSAQRHVVDVFFAPDQSKLEARLRALTHSITKDTRSLLTPFQALLERRLAVLQRVYTAVANLSASAELGWPQQGSLQKAKGASGVAFRCSVHPALDPKSPSQIIPQLPIVPLQLQVQCSADILLVVLKSVAVANPSLASDTIHRLEKSLSALPPLALAETSGKVSAALFPVAAKVVDFLWDLLATVPSHSKKVLELLLRVAVLRGSLRDCLRLVLELLSPRHEKVELNTTKLLGGMYQPEPRLSPPSPTTSGREIRVSLPSDLPVLCSTVSSFVVDTSAGVAIAVVSGCGLLKLSIVKKPRILRFKMLADGGAPRSRRLSSRRSETESVIGPPPPPPRGPVVLRGPSLPMNLMPMPSLDILPSPARETIDMLPRRSELVTETFFTLPPPWLGAPQLPVATGNPEAEISMRTSFQDEGVYSTVLLPRYILVATSNTTTCLLTESWAAMATEFEVSLIDPGSLDEVHRFHVTLEVDSGPENCFHSIPATAARTVTRAISATADSVIFLTTLCMGLVQYGISMVIHRVAIVPLDRFAPSESFQGRSFSSLSIRAPAVYLKLAPPKPLPTQKPRVLSVYSKSVLCGVATPGISAVWPPHRQVDGVTVEAWVCLGGVSERGTIYKHGDEARGVEFFLDVIPGDVGSIIWRSGVRTAGVGGCHASCTTPAAKYIGTWTHVVGVVDPSFGEAFLYINGQQVACVQRRAQAVRPEHLLSPTTPSIGVDLAASITEVRLWGMALNRTTIRKQAFRRLQGKEHGLVAYWPLDEGAGEVVFDRGCHGYHGVLVARKGGAQQMGCWVESTAPIAAVRTEEFTPVLDSGITRADDPNSAIPPVIAYSNGSYIAVCSVLTSSVSSWQIRFYTLSDGIAQYTRTVGMSSLGMRPHAMVYDPHSHKIWAASASHSPEVVLQSWECEAYPLRLATAVKKAFPLPQPTPDRAVVAREAAAYIIHACDMAALPLSRNTLARLFHPMCIDATPSSLIALLDLIDLPQRDALSTYLRCAALRLLRANLGCVIATQADPTCIGFADYSLKDGGGFEIVGEVESRLWNTLSSILNNPDCSAAEADEARAVLPDALMLLVPSPPQRVAAVTALAERAGGTQTPPLTAAECQALEVLLTQLSHLPNMMTVLGEVSSKGVVPPPSSLIAVSNISLKWQSSSGLTPRPSKQSGLLRTPMQSCDNITASCTNALTDLAATLLRRSHDVLHTNLTQATTADTADDECEAPPPSDQKKDVYIGALSTLQKCVIALGVREAAATTIPGSFGNETEDENCPPCTAQVVAYAVQLINHAVQAFDESSRILSSTPGQWVTVEVAMRHSFVGALVPSLVTSLALLIGIADAAILCLLDKLQSLEKALERFVSHLPMSSSRPSTGTADPRRVPLPTPIDTPTFLLPRLSRRGGAHKRGGWDLWADLNHSLFYVMARGAGHVSSADHTAPTEAPCEKWLGSALMRGGPSSEGALDTSRKARVVNGLVSGNESEVKMWQTLIKSHSTNRMLPMLLQRSPEVDRVLRIVYAAVLRHAVPPADFSTLKAGSSEVTVGMMYGFSKIEGMASQLLEMKQGYGMETVYQVEERARLLLRFEPSGHLPTARDLELRMMLAPGAVDDSHEGAVRMNSRGDELQPPKNPKRVSNWKKLFLAWKALRRLQQLLNLTQIHLDPKPAGDSDIASQVVDFLLDSTVTPPEIDSVLKRRQSRGRQRARGLQFLQRLVYYCPRGPMLYDSLVVAVKAVCGAHYCHGLAGTGSKVQGKVQHAVYTLVNDVVRWLQSLAEPPIPFSIPKPGDPQLEKRGMECPPVALLLHLLAIPWQPSDNAFLFASKLPQLLFSLCSVVPVEIAWRGLMHEECSYLTPDVDPEDVPLSSSHSPQQQWMSPEAVHAVLDVSDCPPSVHILPNKLSARWEGNTTFTGGPVRGTVRGSVVWTQNKEVCPQVYYYEVTIIDLAPGAVALGVGPQDYDKARHPGWDTLSCAYHGDDGMLFQGSGSGRHLGPTFGASNTVGCGIVTATHEVFWTLDGRLLSLRVGNFAHDCYPLIGIDTRGSFRVNFGRDPFRFDISRVVRGAERERHQEVPQLAWNLVQSLSLRTALHLRQVAEGAKENDGTTLRGEEAGQVDGGDEDTVLFDQMCSPVQRPSASHSVRSPRSTRSVLADTGSPTPEKSDFCFALAAVDTVEASVQLLASIMQGATVELARCAALWFREKERSTLTMQIARCCGVIASAVYGCAAIPRQGGGPIPAAAEHLLLSLASSGTPRHLLSIAALPAIPEVISRMAFHLLSLILPRLQPAEVAASLRPTAPPTLSPRSPDRRNAGKEALEKALCFLFDSADRVLPSARSDGGPTAESPCGALRLLASLAHSHDWHHDVVTMLCSFLEGKGGAHRVLTALAVIGGLREPLGTGSLVEYCSETKSMKERAHVVSIDLEDGTAVIVDRSLQAPQTVSLSTISLPDPFDWNDVAVTKLPQNPSNRRDSGADDDDRRASLWSALRDLLCSSVKEGDEGERSITACARTAMVLRAVWAYVRAKPSALRWLVLSGLLPSITALAVKRQRNELPHEAAEDKVLMLHSLVSTLPQSSLQAMLNTPQPAAASSPAEGNADCTTTVPPLRYFSTTRTHAPPLMSPSALVQRPAASDGGDSGESDGEGGDIENDLSPSSGGQRPPNAAEGQEDEVRVFDEPLMLAAADERGEEEELEEDEEGEEMEDEVEDEEEDEEGTGEAAQERFNTMLQMCGEGYKYPAMSMEGHAREGEGDDDDDDDEVERGSLASGHDDSPALHFHGGVVCLGNPPHLTFGGPITIEFMVKLRSLTGTNIIVHRGGADGEAALAVHTRGDRLMAGWLLPEPQQSDPAPCMAAIRLPPTDIGCWIHIAAVYDSSVPKWTLYRNGVGGRNTSVVCIPPPIEISEWFLGGRGHDAVGRLNGDLRDFRIWRVALFPSKIAELCRGGGASPDRSGMVLEMRCSEGVGRIVGDSATWGGGGVPVTGQLYGRVSWVGCQPETEVEDELDLTTLNDGEAVTRLPAAAAQSAHACVDRAALWEELRRLTPGQMVQELHVAHMMVARLYARAIVVQALAGWPEGVAMQADALGGTKQVSLLLRVLTDSGQPTAAAIVRKRVESILKDAPTENERSQLLGDLVGESLTLLAEVPQFVVRESQHPFKFPVKGRLVAPRSIGVPGHTRYRILFDLRHSVECGNEALTFATDPECRRVIARYTGSKPWPPLDVNLPNFYYHFIPDPAAPRWGYKFIVQFGYDRFELGLALLDDLIGFCTTRGIAVPRPLEIFNALLSPIAHTASYHRRLLFSIMRQLASSPSDWPQGEVPALGVLSTYRRALDQQYRKEFVSGSFVMHSKFVQCLTELFLTVKDAEVVWRSDTSPTDSPDPVQELQRGVKRYYEGEYRRGSEKVHMLPNPLHDDAGRSIAEAGRERRIEANVELYKGRWYYEVEQCTNGLPAIGVATTPAPGNVVEWNVAKGIFTTSDGTTRTGPLGNVRITPTDVIGVLIDLDAGNLSFTVNGSFLDPACTLDLPAGKGVVPSVWLPEGASALVNFGSTYFEGELPSQFLPIEASSRAFSNMLPFNQIRAFIDISNCLLSGSPLPPYFHETTDYFANDFPDRQGPQLVELITTDGVISNDLECKNMGTAFHSVKANVKVQNGRWYYEVVLTSQGLMQIGWVTDKFVSNPVAGLGVGDDDQSWAVDLYRGMTWHSNQPSPLAARKWKVGDTIGVLINLTGPGNPGGFVSFTLNGDLVTDKEGKTSFFVDLDAGEGVYPAASFRASNGCVFNFGGTALKHRPDPYRALGVADTWLERIDMFYASAGPDWGRRRRELAVSPVSSMTGRWTLARDEELVSLVNALSKVQRRNLHQVALDRRLAPDVWSAHTALASLSEEEIRERTGVLKKFNRLVYTVIPLLNFEMSQRPLATAATLTKVRGVIFQSMADDIIKSVIKSTNGRGEPIRITLNRRKAAHHKQYPDLDPTGRSSLFGQTHELLGDHTPTMFKTSQRFWSVVFTGEGAEDVGGPFREHITEMCAELMSPVTPLFLESPNNRSNVGPFRDCFVPRPSSTSPHHLSMYEFLGRLMGGAIRSSEPLSLYLAPIVWKGIVGQPLELPDLDTFDRICYQCIENFTSLQEKGVTEDMFNRSFSAETFSTTLSDGTQLELIPDGTNIPVTFDRLEEYTRLVAKIRLHESEKQIAAIRAGLCSVIPEYLLSLTTWRDLELKVCGRPDFTVRELKECTTFDGLSKDDQRVHFLWQVLEEISPVHRRAFLRFVSGRERLPVKLRIMPLYCKGNPDTYLPKAATCFFALELPDYSCVEVMRHKLLYAVKHCSDIDTDFRAREFDEDEAPQIGFDANRHEEEMMEIDNDSGGSGEDWDESLVLRVPT